MSLQEFIDDDRAFNFPAVVLNKMTIGGIIHENNNNIYTIKHTNGDNVLAVDENNNLTDSTLKTYVDDVLGTVNEFNITQLSLIGGLQRQMASLNIAIQDTPNNTNFDNLQTQVNTLETKINNIENYIDELKVFFSKFKDAVFIEDPPNSGLEMNYENLI
jgi:hypothetical protein